MIGVMSSQRDARSRAARSRVARRRICRTAAKRSVTMTTQAPWLATHGWAGEQRLSKKRVWAVRRKKKCAGRKKCRSILSGDEPGPRWVLRCAQLFMRMSSLPSEAPLFFLSPWRTPLYCIHPTENGAPRPSHPFFQFTFHPLVNYSGFFPPLLCPHKKQERVRAALSLSHSLRIRKKGRNTWGLVGCGTERVG